GDGPLADLVAAAAGAAPEITWLGAQSHAETISLMKAASLLVFPSQWYETFGLVIAEAYATGLPVVATRLGSAAALVRDGETGYLFTPDDPTDLGMKVRELISRPDLRAAMGSAARRAFE